MVPCGSILKAINLSIYFQVNSVPDASFIYCSSFLHKPISLQVTYSCCFPVRLGTKYTLSSTGTSGLGMYHPRENLK